MIPIKCDAQQAPHHINWTSFICTTRSAISAINHTYTLIAKTDKEKSNISGFLWLCTSSFPLRSLWRIHYRQTANWIRYQVQAEPEPSGKRESQASPRATANQRDKNECREAHYLILSHSGGWWDSSSQGNRAAKNQLSNVTNIQIYFYNIGAQKSSQIVQEIWSPPCSDRNAYELILDCVGPFSPLNTNHISDSIPMKLIPLFSISRDRNWECQNNIPVLDFGVPILINLPDIRVARSIIIGVKC